MRGMGTASFRLKLATFSEVQYHIQSVPRHLFRFEVKRLKNESVLSPPSSVEDKKRSFKFALCRFRVVHYDRFWFCSSCSGSRLMWSNKISTAETPLLNNLILNQTWPYRFQEDTIRSRNFISYDPVVKLLLFQSKHPVHQFTIFYYAAEANYRLVLTHL
jgi:hypothetical protein